VAHSGNYPIKELLQVIDEAKISFKALLDDSTNGIVIIDLTIIGLMLLVAILVYLYHRAGE
jgi:hypothetical protein